MASTISLADYLFTRLRQLGVKSIHGVPGDYNLELLDYVEPAQIHWVGNCNELNAGYAADGYARIKGLGALITTFGVGELSAANAIAGAYAELSPVVHIVGTPARHLQESGALIHHTFNDGDYSRFAKMHAHITVAQANLLDPRTAPAMVDATLQQCLIHSRPVYIQVPVDMVAAKVNAERLSSMLESPISINSHNEDAAATYILERMYSSKRPMILVDGEIRGYGIVDETEQLLKSTRWPTWTSTFAKGLVDESLPNVHGVWRGDFSKPEEKSYIASCDFILVLGPHFSSTNTYQRQSVPDPQLSILIKSTSIQDQSKTFRDVPAKAVLKKVLELMDTSKLVRSSWSPVMNGESLAKDNTSADGVLTQDKFYYTLAQSFRSGDIILAETGTAGYGIRDVTLPPKTRVFKPVTWLSIGYMLPAAQGAALAQRELQKTSDSLASRTILIIGDGSFQMTVQELSTIIREQLDMTIILINNSGYTIERCLHGYKQKYNDIADWRYLQAPSFFGMNEDPKSEYPVFTTTAKTWGELQNVLEDTNMNKEKGLKMVEVFMDREDAPAPLLAYLNMTKKAEDKK